jgi:hypothetical protein
MDHLQQRLEALEQRTYTAEQQLRWWRCLASGLIALGLLTWAVSLPTAQEDVRRGEKDLAQRVAALETLLTHFTREGNEVVITGANLRIVNGLGQTTTINGLGNLIVGYNEPPTEGTVNIRTGSHNVVVGQRHNFSSFGGLVVGDFNTISGAFASVSSGSRNTASGESAAVSGGQFNTASGNHSSVSGGHQNKASNTYASVSGGEKNTASGEVAAVSGGQSNTASGFISFVSGGSGNTASFNGAAVSGGQERKATGESDWRAGSLFREN